MINFIKKKRYGSLANQRVSQGNAIYNNGAEQPLSSKDQTSERLKQVHKLTYYTRKVYNIYTHTHTTSRHLICQGCTLTSLTDHEKTHKCHVDPNLSMYQPP